MVNRFAKARDWDKQAPDDIAKSVCIEAGELLELFQWSSPTVEEIKKNQKKMAELAGELADVFIYALELANLLEFDADEIVDKKLQFADKKYPAELMKRRSAGDSLATKEYLEIKEKYRKNKKIEK